MVTSHFGKFLNLSIFSSQIFIDFCNYSGMLIGRPIVILQFLARKTTAEVAEERGEFNRLFPLCVTLRTLRLNPRFGYSTPSFWVVPAQ
ncbi:MAG: hypothetical protein C5S48_02955 [Candidatus Methanogaster sp.]|nr:MAG: hypothetical protein C5S48_02955 [ANME-2 cluster archaeon]